MTTLWTRLFLYALSGFLLARGLPADFADVLKDPMVIADVNTALAGAVFAATKFWHTLAKKYGWAT
jgi:hypothetical protein